MFLLYKVTPNFAHNFLKTWRNERRRGYLHKILSFTITIMLTFISES